MVEYDLEQIMNHVNGNDNQDDSSEIEIDDVGNKEN